MTWKDCLAEGTTILSALQSIRAPLDWLVRWRAAHLRRQAEYALSKLLNCWAEAYLVVRGFEERFDEAGIKQEAHALAHQPQGEDVPKSLAAPPEGDHIRFISFKRLP